MRTACHAQFKDKRCAYRGAIRLSEYVQPIKVPPPKHTTPSWMESIKENAYLAPSVRASRNICIASIPRKIDGNSVDIIWLSTRTGGGRGVQELRYKFPPTRFLCNGKRLSGKYEQHLLLIRSKKPWGATIFGKKSPKITQ